ncbi:glucosamine-6-phosphate deaminase [Edaphobacter albus]|uniref:glucosamine-6-phosphate deaminase n=1 Tax=Edaphobacter sp. 4G125 TaxID=2763071 RepID=UPI001647959B|nr:glucosamine-6-phosphate deaminase [Edaphobacter sp. 4G125]QNI35784.1 glucosamine-6-phosphate deaminase [Edaphobacter sp. 4G125]
MIAPVNGTHIYGTAKVQVFSTRAELGVAAAADVAHLIKEAVREHGHARIMIATGNSQLDVVKELVLRSDIEWPKVDVFHMDEYVGVDGDHPAGFQRWIRERVEQKVNARSINYISGLGSTDEEIARYTDLLNAGPIDIAFVGIGENGHIAFNDPPVADFNDPQMLKRVVLDATCRQQQVNEGHFATIDLVPKEAITVTCSGLFRAKNWISCVPEARKAKAVRTALEGEITTACPASLAKRHLNTTIYLDTQSASLLTL